MKINKEIIITILILTITLDIPLFSNYTFDIIKIFLRILIILIYLTKIYYRKIYKDFFIINGWYLIILISTLIKRGDILFFINHLSKSYLIYIFLYSYIKKENKFNIVLSTIKNILLFLCIIDFFLIILFPNGILIEKSYYHLNWLLGYKTNRVIYILPLILISSYLDYINLKKISYFNIIIYFLLLYSTYLSKATAGYYTLFLYIIILLILGKIKKRKNILNKINFLLDIRKVFIIIGVIFNFLLLIQKNNLLRIIVEKYLKKEITLSYRIQIWEKCINEIKYNFFLGKGYLSMKDYIDITGYRLGTSAHNFILTILITTGFLGFFYYLWMVIRFYNKNKSISMEVITIKLSYIFSFILGLTSSAWIFSTFSFLLFILLEKESLKLKKLR